MGSVKELTTTGDNDPNIFPEKYYRHYMYCDKCGSFDIKTWIEPADHEKQIRFKDHMHMVKLVSAISAVVALSAVVYSLGFNYRHTGSVFAGYDLLLWLALSCILFVVSSKNLHHLEKKIRYLGVRCGNCQSTYANGSDFFTRLDDNPKNFSTKDVPLPRQSTYWVRGETVE